MVNRDLEFTILRFFLEDINLYKEVSNGFFADDEAITFYFFLQNHIKQYHAIPTEKVILDLNKPVMQLLYLQIMNIPIKLSEFNYYSKKMYDNYLDRKLYDLGNMITNGLLIESGENLRTKVISHISGVHDPFNSVGNVDKGFYWEKARDRWDEYRHKEDNPNENFNIPWGIERFDDVTGGARRRWLICFFSQAKGGKTKTLANMAWNQTVLYKADVMWIAREMGKKDMEEIFDSRSALVDQTLVSKGRLSQDLRTRYLKTLKKVADRRPSLYTVDIPYECSPIEIENSLFEYRTLKGKFPDVVYIDYANLLIPAKPYSSTSERYNFLFAELHEIVRKYNITIVTAVQEGRSGSKVKDKADVTTSDIGLSHYIVPHVEMMIHLYREELDAMTQSLRWSIKASRHTPLDSFSTFALFALNYVGDRMVK